MMEIDEPQREQDLFVGMVGNGEENEPVINEGGPKTVLTEKITCRNRDESSMHVSSPSSAPTPKSHVSRSRFASSLPTLDETEATVSFQEENIAPSSGYPSDASSKKSKRSARGKMDRLEKVKKLCTDATNLAHTGEEEKALNVYEKAITVAGSEIARIHFKIRKSRAKHEATRESIQDRLVGDLRRVGIVVGKLRTKMAILYERSGEYELAVACCREAIEVYKHQPVMKEATKRDKDADELLELMNLMIDKLELAKKALSGRKALLAEIEQLRRDITGTHGIAQKKNLYEKVDTAADKLKRMEVEALGDAHPQVADTLQLLSTIALEQNKQGEAIVCLQKAIKISKASLGMKHPRTGQYFLRLARIHLSEGIESLALDSFGEAAAVLRHSPKFARILGSTFNDVAVIYMRRREFDLAATNLKEALQYYDSALQQPSESEPFEPKHCGLSIDSLQVHRNLGECYMKQKDFVHASEAFLHVLKLQRDGRKVYDKVQDLGLGIVGVERLLVSLIDDESIADTLMRLGRAFAAGDKHQEALAFFIEAAEMLNRIGIADELSHGLSGLTEKERGIKKDQLTNTLYCIAEESSAVGEYDAAIRAYGESMRLRSNFSFSLSQEERQSSIVHCILCFVGLGNAHLMKQESTAAHKLFNDTLSYCKRNGVPSKHPLTALVRQRIKEIEVKIVAESAKRYADLQELEDKAESEIGNEAFERALKTLTQALEMRKTELVKLKTSDECTSEQVYAIARLLRSFGSVFARLGDKENADRAYTDATRLFKKSGAYENISI